MSSKLSRLAEACLRWISGERKRLLVLFVFASLLFAVVAALLVFNMLYIFDAIDARLAEWMK